MICVRCKQLVVETTTGYAHEQVGEVHAPEMKVVELTDDVPHPPPHSPYVDTLDDFEFPEHYPIFVVQVRDFLRMYYYLPGFDFNVIREHDNRSYGHCCTVCADRCRICAARGVDPHKSNLKDTVFRACWEIIRREPHAPYTNLTQFIARIEQMIGYSYKEVEPYVNDWMNQR